MAEAFASEKMFTCMHKHYPVEAWASFAASHADILDYVAVSSGTGDADFAKCNQIIGECNIPSICLDVANGYSEHFIDHVRRVRECNPRTTIIAGNVVTGEICEELLLSGADIIKVGIGPGSVCTTRKQTG